MTSTTWKSCYARNSRHCACVGCSIVGTSVFLVFSSFAGDRLKQQIQNHEIMKLYIDLLQTDISFVLRSELAEVLLVLLRNLYKSFSRTKGYRFLPARREPRGSQDPIVTPTGQAGCQLSATTTRCPSLWQPLYIIRCFRFCPLWTGMR